MAKHLEPRSRRSAEREFSPESLRSGLSQKSKNMLCKKAMFVVGSHRPGTATSEVAERGASAETIRSSTLEVDVPSAVENLRGPLWSLGEASLNILLADGISADFRFSLSAR